MWTVDFLERSKITAVEYESVKHLIQQKNWLRGKNKNWKIDFIITESNTILVDTPYRWLSTTLW